VTKLFIQLLKNTILIWRITLFLRVNYNKNPDYLKVIYRTNFGRLLQGFTQYKL